MSGLPTDPIKNRDGALCGLCDGTYDHAHPMVKCSSCGKVGLAENWPFKCCSDHMSGEKVPDAITDAITKVWNDIYDFHAGAGNDEFRDSMARDESEAVAALEAAILAAIAAARAEGAKEMRDNCLAACLVVNVHEDKPEHDSWSAACVARIRSLILPAPKQGDNEREG